MADTKLSALPAATDTTGAVFYGVQGGVGKQFPASLLSGLVACATRTALKALDTGLAQAALLTEAGREGVFLWMAGNYSALETADTADAIYIKANAIATSAGCWVRIFADSINVEWAGATGDGVTDDAAAIQAAITLAYAHAGGMNVYAPRGTYLFGTQISIPKTSGKSCRFFGDGINATVLSIASGLSTTAGAIAIGSGTSAGGCDINVEDLTVTGANTKKAFYLTNANICHFKRVECRSVAIGVQLENSYFVHLDNCEFDSCATYGIVTLTTAHGLRVTGNGFYSIGGQGVYLGGASASDNIVIHGNDFENTVTPIQFDPGVHGLLFTGNYVEYASGALWSFGATSTGVVIEGNWLALSTSTALTNLVGGRFAANSLYDQAITVGTVTDFLNGGGNLLGGTSALGTLPTLQASNLMVSDSAATIIARVLSSAAATSAPSSQFVRGRGTQASPAAVQSGDRLGAYTFGGQYDTTIGNTRNGAAILGLTTELWSSTAAGCAFTFETTPNGSTSRVEAVRVDQDKALIGHGAVVSDSPTAGIGYKAGAGGAVTQGTSRTTGVTLDKVAGAITLFSAAGSASWQSFTVTNSAVAATDTVIVSQKSGTDLYEIHVTAVAAGSFRISFRTTGGTTTEQPVFNFAIVKAVAA